MHKLNMPVGSTVCLSATARADVAGHRWAVCVYAVGSSGEPIQLVYGSRIGHGDRQQRIDIPAQDVDCRLEVAAQHETAEGDWREDKLTIIDEAPGRLDLGFSDSSLRLLGTMTYSSVSL